MSLRIVYTDDFPADGQRRPAGMRGSGMKHSPSTTHTPWKRRWSFSRSTQRSGRLAITRSHSSPACDFTSWRNHLIGTSSITAFPTKILSPSAWCRERATSRDVCSIRRGRNNPQLNLRHREASHAGIPRPRSRAAALAPCRSPLATKPGFLAVATATLRAACRFDRLKARSLPRGGRRCR